MASSHLSNALKDLVAERDQLVQRQKKLAQRLQVIESGIESLSSLLADDVAETLAPSTNQTAQPQQFVLKTDLPLWHLIGNVLLIQGPMAGKDIAQFLLEHGYETKSGDFANVVGTNLRSTNHFKKLDDGRWTLVDPIAFAAL